jgi:hypothetical protein
MRHRTRPEDAVAKHGWFRLPSGVEATRLPLTDGAQPGLFARLTYTDALEAARLAGARLISLATLLELGNVGLQLMPYLGTPTAETSVEHSKRHDDDVWRQLTALAWDDERPVSGAGKHWVDGAPDGRSRLMGWDRDGAGPGKALWQPLAVAHNRAHHDDGTTTMLERDPEAISETSDMGAISGNHAGSGDRQSRDEDLPPDAWRTPGLTLAERICEWLGWEFGHKVQEIPGSRHNPRIVGYSKECRRGGTFLGVNSDGEPEWDLTTDRGFPLPLPTDELAWCAAFRSAALLANLLPGEQPPPHGLRVSVRELCEDAREADTLRLVGSGYTPKPGDAVIKARNGQNPVHGGQGHVHTLIVSWGDGYRAIGGNEGNAVRVQNWTVNDPAIVAFIET